MLKQVVHVWWLIAGITLISILLVQLGGTGMLATAKATRPGLALGYLIGGILFGLLAIQVYLWMHQFWPDSASRIYFWTAIGLTVLLTVGAIGMMRVVKDAQVIGIWVALNLLWGIGYGWFLPGLMVA